jgi:hypothetical protein
LTQEEPHRRDNRRSSDRSKRHSYSGQYDRRSSDRRESQYIYTIPENTYADGSVYNDAADGQPNVFYNVRRPSRQPYPPDARRTRPNDDRRFSDPAELSRWAAQLRALEAMETRPPNKPRVPSYDVATACGYPCTLITCTSEKGHSYARKLRLKGDAWHEYAAKLLRSGWDFEDVPPSRSS